MTAFQKVFMCAFLLCIKSNFAWSQNYIFERIIDPFPVFQSEKKMALPLLGGLNAPIHQWVDIDADGDEDLFLKDELNALIFLRSDSAGSTGYKWITDRYQDLDIGAWFKFTDYDNDDDYDLFAEKRNRIQLYQNSGNTQSPKFVLVLDTLKDTSGELIQPEGFSIPDWADIDCDGDKDLFMGKQNGRILFYDNIGLSSQNLPHFKLLSQTFQDLEILTGGLNPLPKGIDTQHHGNNSITFTDIDGDEDPDIFWGDFFASSILFLENFGSCAEPRFLNSPVDQYPPANPLISGGFNLSRFADIDYDDDPDMLVSILGGAGSFTASLVENLFFYENRGTKTNPDFILRSSRFLDMIDIGSNTIPAFADIDNDGDSDLFLANEIDVNSPGGANSRIFFLKNEGSAQQPRFVLSSDNYLNMDIDFETNFAPAFADIEADGDLDLFLGSWNGRIIFYENRGTAWLPSFIRASDSYLNIDIGSNSTPAFSDIDDDGDLDLFIGDFNGKITFYRNNGSPDQAQFEQETDSYFSIDVGQFSYPCFFDVNGDELIDLLVGSEDQGIKLYENRGTVSQADFVYNPSFSIPVHLRYAPVMVDLFNTSKADLICGVIGGGLLFYKNNSTAENAVNIKPGQILGFPNPFSRKIRITFVGCSSCTSEIDYHVIIYNSLGEEIMEREFIVEPGSKSISFLWDGKDKKNKRLANGIYFVRAISKSGIVKTGKILLLN